MTHTTEELERLVKPLSWSQYNHAQGVAGQYQWQDWKAPGFRAVFFPSDSGSGEMIGDWHPSEEAAKAACQQHHAEQVAVLLVPVAAVNALPELLALRKENERLREALEKLTDCQPVPKVYKYTGTAEVDVESMFDVGHRHKSGKQPRDYLMSWLSMFRPFAYATKDDSWGELEKLISIVMNNYVQILVRAEAARAALSEEAGS